MRLPDRLRSLPDSLPISLPSNPVLRLFLRRLVLVLAVQRFVVKPALRAGRSRHQHISSSERRAAVAELRQLVPPPPAAKLGGEVYDFSTYCRFLSVCEWKPDRAAPVLREDVRWRSKYKPRSLRPRDMPTACRQTAWQVLMRPIGPQLRRPGAKGERRAMVRGGGLHPPHQRPPLQQWRTTRQGMPITLLEVRKWYPEKYSGRKERVRHVAYHLEHYIRRMPQRPGGRRVQRVCIVFDLRDFRPSTLPYVRECVEVLRKYYPCRLGAALLINVPSYFYPVWKIISPWLDDEILTKTFFLPSSITDTEAALKWVETKQLPDPAIIPGGDRRKPSKSK